MSAAPVELILYVSPASLPCATAQRIIENLLEGYDPARFTFRVCDLTTEADAAVKQRVLSTPTLLKRSPFPAVWVLGDLSRPWVIADLLLTCGVTPRAPME